MGFFSYGQIVEQVATVSASGTTALSSTSKQIQYFNGGSAQTVQLPATTGMTVGQFFEIFNAGAGSLTVLFGDGSSFTPAASVQVNGNLVVKLVNLTATSGTASNGIWFYSLNPEGLSGNVTIGGNLTVNGNTLMSGRAAIGPVAVQNNYGLILSSPMTGATQVGFGTDITFSTASSTVHDFYSNPTITTNTITQLNHFNAVNTVVSSGALTREVGYQSEIGLSSSANFATLADNITFTGGWFINQSGTAASLLGGAVFVKGQTVVGSATADNVTLAEGLQVLGTTTALSAQRIGRYSADAAGSNLLLYKSRGASIGTLAAVTTGDSLGSILFRGVGTDAAAYSTAGSILLQADGTIASGIVPGKMSLRTANSAGTTTTALTIDSAQAATFAGTLAVTGASTFTGNVQVGLGASSANPNIVLESTSATNSGGYIEFQKNGAGTGYVGYTSAIQGGGATDYDLLFQSTGALNFFSNSTAAMTINTSQQVNIANLAGVGTRAVTVNAAGTLTTGAASYTAPTVSTAGTTSHSGGFPANSSGTYTTPTSPAPLYLKIRMVGGGGGGAGSSATGGAGGTGGATTINSTLFVCNGGVGGASGGGNGGLGGTVTTTGGTLLVGIQGSSGGSGGSDVTGTAFVGSGIGGTTPFGGAGANNGNGAGFSAQTNSGSGGGGASTATLASSGSGGGGGAGGYLEIIVSSPASTYTYSVGAGGAQGTAGTGSLGGAGGSGYIVIEEFYQ